MQKDTRNMIDEKRIFDTLSLALGSKYAACNYLSSKAHNKQKEFNYLISESEAITFALTGDIPSSYDRRLKARSASLKQIEDILNYVEDEEVQVASRESFRNSVGCGHLVYSYMRISNVNKQARVRILTRMMYYKYKEDQSNA